MTLHDICERLNCDYEELVEATINLMEITGYGYYTIPVLDEMDRMYEEEE